MATLEYQLTATTNSSTLAASPSTGDLTGYRTTVVIQTNKNVLVTIEQSTDNLTFDPLTNYENLTVNNATSTSTMNVGGYLRINAINAVAGETDTVTVTFRAVSESPTYCAAADVARLLQSYDSVNSSRLTFTSSTFPTLAEVNDTILEIEDYIDELTNHAWRTRRVTEELHSYEPPWDLGRFDVARDRTGIKLMHREIRQLVSGTHKMEVWNGSSWVDHVATYSEGRGSGWWMDYKGGTFYFSSNKPTRTGNTFRATYDYGETTVPHDVRQACALLVAERFLLTSDYHTSAPDGIDEGRNVRLKAEKFVERAMQILREKKEFIMVVEA